MASHYHRIMEAEAAINKITTKIEKTRLENSVLQKFVEKKIVELGSEEDEKKKKKGKVKKDVATTLTIPQKLDIATAINEDLQSEIDYNAKNNEKMIDTFELY